MAKLVVETRSGLIRGVIEKSIEGFEYCAFKGVPYAEPPIGNLRFKDPVPIKRWTGIRDATQYGQICGQYDIISKKCSYNEDCLHLNVYVNSIDNPNADRAVMVWIHGGGFVFGCANNDFYGPDYLLRKDVVLVTINYRLGVLGFLNLQDEIAPGNMGLKDIVMGLQWVRDNIKMFGGNPNNVTIFGESAGGTAVHYLSISPLSKGLFHKAISQSGTAFNVWASKHNHKENAYKICSLLGKQLKDSQGIVDFLRTFDVTTLIEKQKEMCTHADYLPFGPGVDDKSPNPFMPLPPEILTEQGIHVPYLLGHTSREGLFYLLDDILLTGLNEEEKFKKIDENFETVLLMNSIRVLKKYNLTLDQFRRLYYKSGKVSQKNIDKLIDLLSELLFAKGVQECAKVQVEKSTTPTYFYVFSYDPGHSLIKAQSSRQMEGAAHFEELEYLFKMSLFDELGLPHLKKGTPEYRIMEQMTEMWTNFAKYGKPTLETSELIPVHWLPLVDGTLIRYLNIDEDLTMQYMVNLDQKYLSAKNIKC